jgi:adenylate cyclase
MSSADPNLRRRETDVSLDLERFRSLLLDSAGVGLAVAEPGTFRLLMHNSVFNEWFPLVTAGDSPLSEILPALADEDVLTQLAAGGNWKGEIEIKPKRRSLTLAVEVMSAEGAAQGELMVQCQNITKIKELEYMIESYSKMIERQNRDVKREKERVEKLLLNIMPKTVYEEWKEFGVTTPQRYDNATVLMLDFIGFTEMSISQDPNRLISELNDIFTAFDRIVEQFGCDRLKTIGDAYVAVSGVPESNPDHARNIARAALRFVRYLDRRNTTSEFEWRCRIGIHSGPVIGSVVGVQKFVYDLFGPGMNMAARLEQMCQPMEILLSGDTQEKIKTEFRMTNNGAVDIRGFGNTQVWRLDSSFDVANDSPFD